MTTITPSDNPSVPQSTISAHLPTLFPPAQLTLLLGDPGVGKSLLALDLAARLSRGTCLDHNTDSPARSFIASREDDSFTISGRLRAANALPDLITIDGTSSLVPPDPACDAPLIERLRRRRYALVILDPLPAFLENFDCHHSASVRRLLQPLLDLARSHSTAILGIIHHNKSRRSPLASPFHTIAGSYAYSALARSLLAVTPPQNPRANFHHLTPLKSNTVPITHTFPFTIQSLTPDTADSPSLPIIQWHTPIPLMAHDLTQEAQQVESSQLELACDFLRTTLAQGPLPAAALQKQARSLALSPRTLSRARQHVPLNYSHNGLTGTWYVTLAKPTPACRENFAQLQPTSPVAVRAHGDVAPLDHAPTTEAQSADTLNFKNPVAEQFKC